MSKLNEMAVREQFNDIRDLAFYPFSCVQQGETELVVADVDGGDALFVTGGGPLYDELAGQEAGQVKRCDLSHENRLVVNRYIDYTVPRALGNKAATLGLGDRLGIFNYTHLRAIKGSGLLPVLAQQSLRELTLTGRTYDDVLDAAAWAVLKFGWRDGYGADGDHLKYAEDIDKALEKGYTMITLDCSEVLKDAPADQGELDAAYAGIPEDVRTRMEEEYITNNAAGQFGISYDLNGLKSIAVTYLPTIQYAKDIYENHILKAGRPIDFELSVDETESITSPAAHFFVANELAKENVVITSLAPRFVGEFQKGIDYIGDKEEFARDLDVHAAIAKQFDYKVSVHSGSDKFSIFPYVGRATNGCFHVKTSGTSWLEAVHTMAISEPTLYRDMHKCALHNLEAARKNYHVRADLANVPPLGSVADADLPNYLKQDDSRQLMHITYGSILENPYLKYGLLYSLNRHKAELDAVLYAHIKRHVDSLR